LDSVTPSEAAELTFYGSEVIHPFTMDQVIRAAIPIRIKNVMNPRNQGTVITPDPLDGGERCRSRPGMWRGRSVSNLSAMGRLKEREGRLPKRYVVSCFLCSHLVCTAYREDVSSFRLFKYCGDATTLTRRAPS